MAKVTVAEQMDKMVAVLREWQGIERKSVEQTSEIMESTSNSYVRLIMELIRHDSLMHHRVQQFLIDTLTRDAISLTPEELAVVWDKIEAHDQAEKRVIELAQELKQGTWSVLQKQLVDYLATDEAKHDELMEQLGKVKRGMYPYGA